MKDEDTFYAALGRAISQWAVVEQSLNQLYVAIMKPQLWVVTSSTYHVSQTFRGKLALVDTAIKASYNHKSYEKLQANWRKLNNKLTKKSARRNDIAHLLAFNHNDNGLQMRPDPYNAKSLINEDYKSKIYDTKRLKSLKATFKDLSVEINDFTRHLPPPPLLRRK